MKSLLLITTIALLPSCSYVQNRTNDLLDVFWLDVDVGVLAAAEVRATDFCAVGVGASLQSVPLVHVHGRHFGHVERMSGGLPVYWSISMYKNDEMVPFLDGTPAYSSIVQPPPCNYLLFYPEEFFVDRHGDARYRIGRRGLRVLDCAVGASLGVGVRVGFSPGHLLDFLLGWFGLDLAGDDAFGGVEDAALSAPPRAPTSS